MNLLTSSIRKSLPAIGTTDGQGDNAVIRVKFFSPTSSFSWFATEFDGEDTFFGLVDSGYCKELGYFSLSELQSVRGPYGVGIERDMYFGKKTIGDMR